MIAYPVRYNRDDECVEDAEFKVLGHPFSTVDEGEGVKHERGIMIADAVNAYVPGTIPKPGPIIRRDEISPLLSIYDLPEKVYSELSPTQKKNLARIERKHKKLVAKLIAKTAQMTKQDGGNNGQS